MVVASATAASVSTPAYTIRSVCRPGSHARVLASCVRSQLAFVIAHLDEQRPFRHWGASDITRLDNAPYIRYHNGYTIQSYQLSIFLHAAHAETWPSKKRQPREAGPGERGAGGCKGRAAGGGGQAATYVTGTIRCRIHFFLSPVQCEVGAVQEEDLL